MKTAGYKNLDNKNKEQFLIIFRIIFSSISRFSIHIIYEI